jgi:hypothetical protein
MYNLLKQRKVTFIILIIQIIILCINILLIANYCNEPFTYQCNYIKGICVGFLPILIIFILYTLYKLNKLDNELYSIYFINKL